MNLEFLNHQEIYLVAVSGGPDSMALLHALMIQGYRCRVAHINYNLRASSLRDQEIVQAFCGLHQIPLDIKIVNERPTTNLQAWARKIRYEYFLDIAEKYGIKTVLVAHHKDDDVETFLMQKIQHKTPEYYGIRPLSSYHSLNIARPLIHVSKDVILDYCFNHQIPFGVDETNTSFRYLRNRVRNQISKLSLEERQRLLDEMNELNKSRQTAHQESLKFLMNNSLKNGIKIKDILALSDEVRFLTVASLLSQNRGNSGYFRSTTVLTFLSWLTTSRDGEVWGTRQFTILRLKDQIMLQNGLQKRQSLVLDQLGSIGELGDYQFSFTSQSGFQHIPVDESEFPLHVVMPYPPGSKLSLKTGHQKVSRFFINHKIDKLQREHIPVIINNRGIVIAIVGFYTQVRRKHMQHTLTVIK